MKWHKSTPYRTLVGGVLALVFLATCSETPPAPEAPETEPQKVAQDTPDAVEPPPRAATLFAQHCALCHGERGEADGPGSQLLFPPARDFGTGEFRLVSTENGLPSDDDLRSVLVRGMPGSAMPSWGWLSEEDLDDLVDHVRILAERSMASRMVAMSRLESQTLTREEAQRIARENLAPGTPLEVGSFGVADEAALERGRTLYGERCASCHGDDGRGTPDRPEWNADGVFNWARDFTAGVLRGRTSNEDIAHRILAGIPGTTMPRSTFEDSEDLEALVAYVRSLIPDAAEDRYVQRREVLLVPRVPGPLPPVGSASAWEQAPEIEIALAPLTWRKHAITHVSIVAVHDGKELSVRLRWKDETRDDRALGGAPFGDAAALQWSAGKYPPAFGMGSHRDPVAIWHWKTFRVQDVSGLLDLMGRPPHGRGDLDAPRYVPAPAGAAIQTESEGIGDVPTLTAAGLDVRTWAQWNDGMWEVIFQRSLGARDTPSVRLAPGAEVQLSLAIWNGSAGDDGSRKSISIWQKVLLSQ